MAIALQYTFEYTVEVSGPGPDLGTATPMREGPMLMGSSPEVFRAADHLSLRRKFRSGWRRLLIAMRMSDPYEEVRFPIPDVLLDELTVGDRLTMWKHANGDTGVELLRGDARLWAIGSLSPIVGGHLEWFDSDTELTIIDTTGTEILIPTDAFVSVGPLRVTLLKLIPTPNIPYTSSSILVLGPTLHVSEQEVLNSPALADWR